jgi:alginate O-acetyltransferase complex protein AlgJ
MKHLLKYIVTGLLASLLFYIALSVFVDNRILVCCISVFIAICFIFIIGKTVKKYKFSFIFMVSVFFFILLAPIAGKKEITSLEKRSLTGFPKLYFKNIWAFTHSFSDWFNDRFAYRNASISFLGKLKYHTFHESPMPNLVEIGKDSTLYYTPVAYVNDISEPFSPQKLDSIRLTLEIMTKWFNSKGIKYYFTSPPVKEHVYPELMSPLMQYRTKFSRLDQVCEYIKGDTNIRFIDYRKELIENKKTRPTYLETDGHWNKFGAFFAYHKIMERMKRDFPQIKMTELSDYTMDSTMAVGGDLEDHLGFDDLFLMHYYSFTPKNGTQPTCIDSSKLKWPTDNMLVQVREMPEENQDNLGNVQASPLKLFVVRDSYTDAFMGYFPTQFRQTVYAFNKRPPIDLIIQVHPDIILHEMLERYLGNELKLPDEIVKDSVFLKKNFPGYYNSTPNP